MEDNKNAYCCEHTEHVGLYMYNVHVWLGDISIIFSDIFSLCFYFVLLAKRCVSSGDGERKKTATTTPEHVNCGWHKRNPKSVFMSSFFSFVRNRTFFYSCCWRRRHFTILTSLQSIEMFSYRNHRQFHNTPERIAMLMGVGGCRLM